MDVREEPLLSSRCRSETLLRGLRGGMSKAKIGRLCVLCSCWLMASQVGSCSTFGGSLIFSLVWVRFASS